MAHDAEVYAQEGPRHAEQLPHGAANEAPPGPAATPPGTHTASGPHFLLMAGGSVLALVFGMIGACLSLNLFENSSHAASPGPRPPAAPGPDRSADVKALRTQIDTLSQRIDGLKDRVDAMPKGDSTAGLATLQVQVADLTKAAREAAPLPAHVESVNRQLGQLSQDILSLRREIADVQLRLSKADAPSPPVALPTVEAPQANVENAPAPEAPPVVEVPKVEAPPQDDGEQALKRAVSLFKKGKFKDALAAFDKLELARPDDARVWYYAALSRGFATNEWTDDTEKLVEKGVDREQAGTPAPAEIDRAFRDLTIATGKEWLASYRARVKKE